MLQHISILLTVRLCEENLKTNTITLINLVSDNSFQPRFSMINRVQLNWYLFIGSPVQTWNVVDLLDMYRTLCSDFLYKMGLEPWQFCFYFFTTLGQTICQRSDLFENMTQ